MLSASGRRGILLLLSAAGLAACGRAPASRGPSDVLVVTIDTLRADHVGAYGAASGATPAMDALARESTLFESAITPAPLTLPAHTALLSGVLPFRSGVRVNGTDHVAENVPLLAPDFSKAGYQTAAFVSSLVLRKAAGLARGFGTYDDDFQANLGKDPREFVAERKGGETVDRALAWLSRRDSAKPFFVWAHLYDPHAPYEPPEPFASRFAGRPYEGEVAYADACLARLLSAVNPAKTIVVVCADHGESLGEHGESGHGVFLYDATVRVPLLLRLPDRSHAGERVRAQVRLTDIAPTIRRMASLPQRDGDGEDLALLLGSPRAADRPAFSESDYPAFVLGWSPMRALRFHGEKFIDAPRRELYDLSRDSGELSNAFSSAPARASALARELRKITGRPPLATATSSAIDPEAARRLASLGYIAGGAASVDYDRIDSSRVDPKDHILIWSQIESGLIARQMKRYEGAVAIFERLLASYPTVNPVILRDYAQACRFTGRLDRAVELYAKIVKTTRPESDDFFGLGVTWHLKGDEGRACQDFERAVALDPSDLSSWIDLGNGRLALRRFGAARDAFERARAIDAHSVDALAGLASAAFEERDFDTAERRLREAAALSPGDPATQFNLAIVEENRGNLAGAREIYRHLALSGDRRVALRAASSIRRLRLPE